MSNQDAKRRYFRIFIPAMVIFLAASLGIAWAGSLDAQPSWWTIGFAVMPIGALLAVLWAHLRFVNEIDEFLRSIQIKGIMTALTVILAIATGWGFLENYADAPRLHIFWLNPIYWIAYGIATSFFTWRATGHLE